MSQAMMFMSQGSSKYAAEIVAPGQPDTVVCKGPDLSSAGRISGSGVSNNMESGLYTWTPAQEAGRSVRQKIESFSRRLFGRR
jgi:hypothetical protein